MRSTHYVYFFSGDRRNSLHNECFLFLANKEKRGKSKMILEPHEKLKLLRLRKKYTQSDLAQLTHCSQMEISRIERGEKKPNTHTRHMIEQILGRANMD